MNHLSDDDWLKPYLPQLQARHQAIMTHWKTLQFQCNWHDVYGLHKTDTAYFFREWLPNATAVWLVGTFNDWQQQESFRLRKLGNGSWECRLPLSALSPGDEYMLFVQWEGGEGYRLPSAARRVIRHEDTIKACGVVFHALVEKPAEYVWQHSSPQVSVPLIYEAHVGMATEEERIGTFAEFTRDVLPRIAAGGYTCVQLMGIMQHPYYGSFGYHVSNFFSVCDLFGTPDEFKRLVDTAHGLGLRVIIDLVHSHAVKNEEEGLSLQDGTDYAYFHSGSRGWHAAWDSRCFNYGKPEVLRFLLSNCRFWLEEYHIDGFRFDGVTSMMYLDHGLGHAFTGYADYFGSNVDEDAIVYLGLANQLIHTIRPDAWTLAEDVSGMPGLAAPCTELGLGFDCRLALGVTDIWFKLLDITPDEAWPIGTLWYELNNRRHDEHSLSYVECHDQAMVGGKTFLFTCIDAAMYTSMHKTSQNLLVDRGIALHKLSRLITATTSDDGYLTFMGNEFGHPEWIDFPRADNGWSYHHARRQWSLRDNPQLRFGALADFDAAMLSLIRNQPGFYAMQPREVYVDHTAKIIIYERGGLYFCFNFHPSRPQPQWPVIVEHAGTYGPVLDTDNPAYGGFGNIGGNWTTPTAENGDNQSVITINLPPRTAMVLKQIF